MSFTKLKDRINGLPLVLAGPIVRRVEPKAATVWVALRRSRRMRMKVFDAAGTLVAEGTHDTRAIGANLHIACITAVPLASGPLTAFAAGTTYQYNLFFDHLGGFDDIQNGADLFGPRIVSTSDVPAVAEDEARVKLTYANDGGPTRPSFVLPPPELSQLRVLHGSCRKVSGEHSDALEAADHILREEFKTPKQRPHMLFLTGDNIYNDGCEIDEFKVILDAAPVLLGWDESILIVTGSPPNISAKFSEMSGPRWGHSLGTAGLSNSGPHYRHFFGLGESLALYLHTFADILWPPNLEYQNRTFQFRGTLPAVRRALANIATYMIFDDHEFTNSWNLTAEWVESVLGKPLGRRIYQNALSAYALCQGWGNTPDRFETGAGKELLDALVDWSTAERGGTSSPNGPLGRIAKSVGLPEAAAFHAVRDWSGFHGSDVIRWDYTVPCPGLNILVLDAYMWRAYEDAYTNPIIIGDAGLNQQIDQALFPETECSLIVVSNVAISLPGGGGAIKELRWKLLNILTNLLLPTGLILNLIWLLVALFMEAILKGPFPPLSALIRLWMYGPEYGAGYEHQTKGFELLISRAAHRAPQLNSGKRQARVVFLSGDVHYTCCMRMEYWSRVPFGKTAAAVEGVLAQLTSSPCKWVNPSKSKLDDTKIHHFAGWSNQPTLTWTSQPKASPWRFKKSPWMMEYDPTASQPLMNPDPEWRYSLQPITPKRPVDHEPLEIPDRPNPTLDDQFAEMEQIEPIIVSDLESADFLKVNNLADVIFNWTPGSREVIQRVWWRGRPAIDSKWAISKFIVPMEPAASPPRLPH